MKKREAPKQAQHVTPMVVGGAAAPEPPRRPRRSEQLRVLTALHEPVFEARPGLPPGGRAECRDGPRPCTYVRCRFHLWLVLAQDRRGRRRDASETTVEPVTETTCALDVADRERTATEIGEMLGITNRRVQQIVKAAVVKLRALGVPLEALR